MQIVRCQNDRLYAPDRIAADLFTRAATSKLQKRDFWHFRSITGAAQQHTDGCDWLARYDFLLVFYVEPLLYNKPLKSADACITRNREKEDKKKNGMKSLWRFFYTQRGYKHIVKIGEECVPKNCTQHCSSTTGNIDYWSEMSLVSVENC